MVEAIILGAGGLTSLASTIYFAVKYASEVRHAAAVEVAQAHVEGELARLHFEIETTSAALTESQRRNRVLVEALNVEMSRASDLAPDDVAGRLRRIEVAFSTDYGIPAVDVAGGVSPGPAADPAKAGGLPTEPATELR